MSRIEDLISHHCPNGVEYHEVSNVLEKVRSKGKLPRSKYEESGLIEVIDQGQELIAAYSSDLSIANPPAKWILFGDHTRTVKWWEGSFVQGADGLVPLQVKITGNPKFYYYAMKNLDITNRGYNRHWSVVKDMKLPVPPLEVQDEIVRILDSFTQLETDLESELEAELEARRKQYEYYRDSLLSLENLTSRLGKEHVKLKPLGEIGAVKMCKRILKNQTAKVGEIPFYKIGTFGKEPNAFIDFNTYEKLKKKYPFPTKGNILISASGTIGNTVIYDGKPAYFQDSNIVWLEHNQSIVLDKYLYYVYQMNPWVVPEGGTIKRLYNDIILKTKIPVPSLAEQERIVAILDKFDALVNDLSSGLPAEIAARRKQYEYYRDQLLTFTPAK